MSEIKEGPLASRGWESLFMAGEVIVILLYCTCATMEDEMHSHTTKPDELAHENEEVSILLARSYPLFMDVHLMLIIGFGFLMVFLKTQCWTSVGFSHLVASWVMPLGILFQGFWIKVFEADFSGKINVNLHQIIEGQFCAAACLITYGALLGKCTLPQIFLLVTCEAFMYCLNAVIVLAFMECHDVGGAMTIHMFGAFFGIAASFFFQPARAFKDERGVNGGNYNTQFFAMIGTVFLFIYWPSFNGILATGMARQRAIVNTTLSISSSVLSSIFVSRAYLQTIDMEVMLNATLAGGVMMGAAADILYWPGFVIAAGALAGVVSACGYLMLTEGIRKNLNIQDTCGVIWLHGIPGTMGAIVAAIAVGTSAYTMENDINMADQLSMIKDDRTVGVQVGYQFAGIVCTLMISITSGAIFGLIASRLPMPKTQFDDACHFEHCVYGDDCSQENHNKPGTTALDLAPNVVQAINEVVKDDLDSPELKTERVLVQKEEAVENVKQDPSEANQ